MTFSKDPGEIVEHVNHAQNEALLQLPLTALEVYHARLSHYFLRNPEKGCLNLSLKLPFLGRILPSFSANSVFDFAETLSF